MLNFNDEKQRLVAEYYKDKIGSKILIEIASNAYEIENKEQALELAAFYWQMLDESAKNKDEGVVVLGEANLQPTMEKLFHVIGGYLVHCGYEAEWNKVCDEA